MGNDRLGLSNFTRDIVEKERLFGFQSGAFKQSGILSICLSNCFPEGAGSEHLSVLARETQWEPFHMDPIQFSLYLISLSLYRNYLLFRKS